MTKAASLKLMLVGDLILDEPDPDSFFEPSRSILQQADLLVGHVEVTRIDVLVGRIRVGVSGGGEDGAVDAAGALIKVSAGMDAERVGPPGWWLVLHNSVSSGRMPTAFYGLCRVGARSANGRRAHRSSCGSGPGRRSP